MDESDSNVRDPNSHMLLYSQTYALGDIRKNQLIQRFFIVREELFEMFGNDQFQCTFDCVNDPRIQSSSWIQFHRHQFVDFDRKVVEMFADEWTYASALTFSLSKMAAHSQILDCSDNYDRFKHMLQREPESANLELEMDLLKNLSIQTSKTYEILSDFTEYIGVAIKLKDPLRQAYRYLDISVRKHFPNKNSEIDP